MEYLVPYLAGVLIMLAIQLWVRHRHRQYYKLVIYMTLVLSGAYRFSKYLFREQAYIYVGGTTLALALLAAFITRLSLRERGKPQ